MASEAFEMADFQREVRSVGETQPRPALVANPESGCWEWQGWKNQNGYGMWGTEFAHRRHYRMAYGSIPEGAVVHHDCGNPSCVNPDHLVALSAQEHRGHHAKLTERDVETIRVEYMAGVPACVLADRFDVSLSHIGHIIAGRRRLDSPGPILSCRSGS